MPLISFQLSMPNNNSWNGKWSGEGQPYFIVKNLRKTDVFKVLGSEKSKSFYYDFQDGWGANVYVEVIDAKEARRRRRATQGFRRYDWMVKEIIQFGRIATRHERQGANALKSLLSI